MKKRAFSCLLMVAIIISLLHINIYAEEIANNSNHTTQAFDNLTRLTPEHVQSLIDELNNQAAPTPRLTEDDILSSRTIYTTDNSPLQALTVRPLTELEINGYLYDTSVYCRTMTLLYENEEDLTPTSSYNCHYYAWCRDWCDEEYWINYAEPIVDDVHTNTFTNEDNVQVGDIVTYWVNGECKHSAIVYSFINGQIFCKSKWGANGLFIHPIDDVPPEYKNNGQKNVKFHRYDHGIHFWGWNNVSNSHHEWKCHKCTVTTNARAPHDYQKTGRYNDSGHQMICNDCSSSIYKEHKINYTGIYNGSGHQIYCSDCSYSVYEDHELYMYEDNGEDGCIVKCYDCPYTLECYDGTEYEDSESEGHYIGCPDGCFSIFEEHDYSWSEDYNANGHVLECRYCGYTEYFEHELYTYAVYEGDGGSVIKCRACDYTYEYQEDPEFWDLGIVGHSVDAGSCHFIEPHHNRYSSQGFGSHLAICDHCGYYDELSHEWFDNGSELECIDCGETISYSQLNSIGDLTDEELAILVTFLPEDKLKAFISLLPEADLARVTALLPPDDGELLIE